MSKPKAGQSVNLAKALVDPDSVFATPEEVLDHAALSHGEKIEILRRWEYDASEVDVAREEGMPGSDNDLLRRVLLALEQLATVDPEQAAPTKQHGLPRSAVKPK
jgi:hypothetical protein